MDEYYVAAFDLGSSKITGAIAKKDETGFSIIAQESEVVENNAFFKGRIVDCDTVALLIKRILMKLSNVTSIKNIRNCFVTYKDVRNDMDNAKRLASLLNKKTTLIFPDKSSISLIADYYATEEEKSDGYLAIDFGDTSISFKITDKGEDKMEKVIPAGSRHLTNDIQAMFEFDFELAEKLKTRLGKAYTKDGEKDKLIRLGGDKSVKMSELTFNIQKRTDDLFKYIITPVVRTGWNKNKSHKIIITGGGAALTNIKEYLESKTTLSVRILVGENEDIERLAALKALISIASERCYEVPKKKSGILSKMTTLFNKGKDKSADLFSMQDEETFSELDNKNNK